MDSPRESRPLRIVLVEDSPLLGTLLRATLDELDGVTVVAVATDEAGAVQALQDERPDLAILDLKLGAGSGLGILGELRHTPERFGSPVTVVFTNHAYPHLRERCAALGVARFFDKTLELDALIDYVEAMGAEGVRESGD